MRTINLDSTTLDPWQATREKDVVISLRDVKIKSAATFNGFIQALILKLEPGAAIYVAEGVHALLRSRKQDITPGTREMIKQLGADHRPNVLRHLL